MKRWMAKLECGHRVASDEKDSKVSYCPYCALWNAIKESVQFEDEEMS